MKRVESRENLAALEQRNELEEKVHWTCCPVIRKNGNDWENMGACCRLVFRTVPTGFLCLGIYLAYLAGQSRNPWALIGSSFAIHVCANWMCNVTGGFGKTQTLTYVVEKREVLTEPEFEKSRPKEMSYSQVDTTAPCSREVTEAELSNLSSHEVSVED
jgi:hypothetical protein